MKIHVEGHHSVIIRTREMATALILFLLYALLFIIFLKFNVLFQKIKDFGYNTAAVMIVFQCTRLLYRTLKITTYTPYLFFPQIYSLVL